MIKGECIICGATDIDVIAFQTERMRLRDETAVCICVKCIKCTPPVRVIT